MCESGSVPSSPETSCERPLVAMPVARARLNTTVIKERLLQFCKRATSEYYQVRNVE